MESTGQMPHLPKAAIEKVTRDPNGQGRRECMERTYSFADIAAAYRTVTQKRGGSFAHKLKGTVLDELRRNWKSSGKSDFYGASTAEMNSWLSDGYEYPGSHLTVNPTALDSDRERWIYSDDPEGDFDYTEFLNGETDYYLARTMQKTRPGVRLRLAMDMSAGTHVRVIAEYGLWVGQAISALLAQGYDLEISTCFYVTDIYPGETPNLASMTIRLTEFGQVILPQEWSAVFSPGGYRHLIFLAAALPEQTEDKRVYSGLGHCISRGSGWDVRFDGESRTLSVDCPATPRDFDTAGMTEKLTAIQAEL